MKYRDKIQSYEGGLLTAFVIFIVVDLVNSVGDMPRQEPFTWWDVILVTVALLWLLHLAYKVGSRGNNSVIINARSAETNVVVDRPSPPELFEEVDNKKGGSDGSSSKV